MRRRKTWLKPRRDLFQTRCRVEALATSIAASRHRVRRKRARRTPEGSRSSPRTERVRPLPATEPTAAWLLSTLLCLRCRRAELRRASCRVGGALVGRPCPPSLVISVSANILTASSNDPSSNLASPGARFASSSLALSVMEWTRASPLSSASCTLLSIWPLARATGSYL
jgi:hypothetical protein